MSMETKMVKASKDVASEATRIVDGMLKKTWSILDAAVEKQAPTEILNQKAIKNIQGIT